MWYIDITNMICSFPQLVRNPTPEPLTVHSSQNRRRAIEAIVRRVGQVGQSLTPLPISTDAIYFDYKRRHDPEFRKALKRDRKRHVRSERAQQAAASAQQREVVAKAVRQVQLEGFPIDVEEKEMYFMQEVAQGEVLCQEGAYCPTLERPERPTGHTDDH